VSLRAGAPRSPIGLEDLDQFAKGGQLFLRHTSDTSKSQSTQTDDSGNFAAKGLVEGTYEAQIYVQGTNGMRKCGTLKAGDTNAKLVMVP